MKAVAAEGKASGVVPLKRGRLIVKEQQQSSNKKKKRAETEVKLAFDKRHQKWACKTFTPSHE